MVHELIGSTANRVSLRHVPGIKKEFEEVVLAAHQDPFFAQVGACAGLRVGRVGGFGGAAAGSGWQGQGQGQRPNGWLVVLWRDRRGQLSPCLRALLGPQNWQQLISELCAWQC